VISDLKCENQRYVSQHDWSLEREREICKPVSKLDFGHNWADIQRRGSILEWMVILSVYGADTIAIDLSLSALIS
jgi:hypothetical protein